MKAEDSDPEATPSKIKVVIRMRPFLPKENDPKPEVKITSTSGHIRLPDSQSVDIAFDIKNRKSKRMVFDSVLNGETSQQTFFEKSGIEPMIDSFFNGYHATVFAYG